MVEKGQYFPFGINQLTWCHAGFRWYLPSNWRVWEEDSQRIFATMFFPLESSWTTNPEANLACFWWNSWKIYNSIYSMHVFLGNIHIRIYMCIYKYIYTHDIYIHRYVICIWKCIWCGLGAATIERCTAVDSWHNRSLGGTNTQRYLHTPHTTTIHQ